MSDVGRKAHWENVYATKSENEVGWFQENPAPSLELIALTGISGGAAIIDIGGGASRLVDALVERKITTITVLDLSATALDATRKRLGDSGAYVEWVVADVTTWEPSRTCDLWHDRCVSFPCRCFRSFRLCRSSEEGRQVRRTRHHRHLCSGWTRTVQRPANRPL
jgi:hypothetical protein